MTERSYEAVKFEFGSADVQELGHGLAREWQNIADLEARRKEVAADLASQIKAAYGRVNDIALKLNNGYEMREVEVLVLWDEPRMGMKRTVRVDTSVVLREEAMSLQEMQRGFGFTEPGDPNGAL